MSSIALLLQDSQDSPESAGILLSLLSRAHIDTPSVVHKLHSGKKEKAQIVA